MERYVQCMISHRTKDIWLPFSLASPPCALCLIVGVCVSPVLCAIGSYWSNSRKGKEKREQKVKGRVSGRQEKESSGRREVMKSASSQQQWCVEPALTSVCVLPRMAASSHSHEHRQSPKCHSTGVLFFSHHRWVSRQLFEHIVTSICLPISCLLGEVITCIWSDMKVWHRRSYLKTVWLKFVQRF